MTVCPWFLSLGWLLCWKLVVISAPGLQWKQGPRDLETRNQSKNGRTEEVSLSAPRSMCPNCILISNGAMNVLSTIVKFLNSSYHIRGLPYWTTLNRCGSTGSTAGEAEPLYRQTLEQREAKLGLRHPHTLRLGGSGWFHHGAIRDDEVKVVLFCKMGCVDLDLG